MLAQVIWILYTLNLKIQRGGISNKTIILLLVVVTCSQIVSVLRESNGGDGARVAGEVGYIGALLQIPDLDLRVSCSSTEDETIRVELSAGESCEGQTGTLPPGIRLSFILANTQTLRHLPQPALSSVTLVRTLPVWMSEKAQYCRIRQTERRNENYQCFTICKGHKAHPYFSKAAYIPDPQRNWAGSPR